MIRCECNLLMNARQSVVMIDCLLNVDQQRLEAGWVGFRTGDYSPTMLLTGKGLEVEIELPLSRRHFIQDVMQYSPDESQFFRLAHKYLKQFRDKEL